MADDRLFFAALERNSGGLRIVHEDDDVRVIIHGGIDARICPFGSVSRPELRRQHLDPPDE
ncbi:hypothetical protein ACFU7X_42260 [Streptomyces chartreusis]|uniref:hypothetical protein n=1 Tax=Streptomyces chartreusis TaxID=1969 RepID=UPI00369D3449